MSARSISQKAEKHNRSDTNSRSCCCEAELLHALDPIKGSATPLEKFVPVISRHKNISSLVADKLGYIDAFLCGGFDAVAELVERGDIDDPEFFFQEAEAPVRGKVRMAWEHEV